MKKKIFALFLSISILASCAMSSACYFTGDGSSSSSTSSTDDSSTDDSSTNDSSTDDSSTGDSTDDNYDQYAEQAAIVDQAYALSVGHSLGYYTLSGTVTKINEPYNGTYIILTFAVPTRESKPIYCYKLQGDGVDIIAVGDTVTVYGNLKNYRGTIEFDKNCLLVDFESDFVPPDPDSDPYANVSKTEFYANYSVATDNTDAYYRTKNGLLSGENQVPDQAPEIADYQPRNGDKLIRNTDMLFSDDGNTYTVVDAFGQPAFNVYRDGAYITLEEVAAYVYAFETYPKNYSPNKDTSPSSSVWGEYLRVNHTPFSGDTDRFPYEPKLPNISGCGGSLHYYEMDIGTTGTDCDPSYPCKLYNNGSSITRGAARIVYAKDDLDGDGVFERGEFHVFYTYNHYNDFQEYLNYEGGWGETFGNITGGGTISSKYDYNPTDYVEVDFQPLTSAPKAISFIVPKKRRFFDE